MKSLLKTCIIFIIIVCLIPIFNSCTYKPGKTSLSTESVTDISQTSAVSGGNLKTGKNGTMTAKGVFWSTTADLAMADIKTDNGTGTGIFVCVLSGLHPGTTYYVKAYAICGTDTAYGNTISFTTQGYGSVSDIEGNRYKTINIGAQTWMANNLKTTKYNNGTAILPVTDEAVWDGLLKPGYSWYKNDEAAFKATYGALYNWYTVSTGKLCPAGWHIPGEAEWTMLTTYLGGESVAGGKLKETGSIYWVDPNGGATNELSYSALPGGFRYYDGKFFDFGFSGYWWSSGESSESKAWFRLIYYEDGSVYRFDGDKKMGLSVRCIKNL